MMDIIPTNPMVKVAKPNCPKPDRRYWTVEETRRFIEVASHSSRKWSPLCLLLVSTGLRISEALGLTWQDVNLDKNLIHITTVQVHTDGQFIAGPPKTRSGRRSISLDNVGSSVMKTLARDGGKGGVFRTRKGKPPVPGVIIRELRQLCDEAGVPRLTPHGLRHVHAMLALEATGDAYLVQRRLGHSHISVTLGLYGYSLRKDYSVASALNELLACGDDQLVGSCRGSHPKSSLLRSSA